MRTILSLAFLLAAWASIQAQTADAAREAANQLIQKYGLDTEQAAEARTIQERKQRNLAEIEPLKTSDPVRYRAKLESIQQGTHASLRRLLTTPEQRAIFQQTLSEQRRLRAEKRLALEAQGKSQPEVEEAVLEIYLE